MNTAALSSLWTYIQSLMLTSSNKRWLAAHLYESAATDIATSNIEDMLPIVSANDFQLSPETLSLVAGLEPMDEETNYDEIRLKYFKDKYQL